MCVTIMAKYKDDRLSIKHQELEKVDLTEPIDTPTTEYSTLELSLSCWGHKSPQTMKLQGGTTNTNIVVLIGSGANHNLFCTSWWNN